MTQINEVRTVLENKIELMKEMLKIQLEIIKIYEGVFNSIELSRLTLQYREMESEKLNIDSRFLEYYNAILKENHVSSLQDIDADMRVEFKDVQKKVQLLVTLESELERQNQKISEDRIKHLKSQQIAKYKKNRNSNK